MTFIDETFAKSSTTRIHKQYNVSRTPTQINTDIYKEKVIYRIACGYYVMQKEHTFKDAIDRDHYISGPIYLDHFCLYSIYRIDM